MGADEKPPTCADCGSEDVLYSERLAVHLCVFCLLKRWSAEDMDPDEYEELMHRASATATATEWRRMTGQTERLIHDQSARIATLERENARLRRRRLAERRAS